MAEALTLGEVLRRSTGYLEEAGSETARLDAELLLGQALSLQRIELYMHLDRPLTPAELGRARGLVARRGKREPLQYVLGSWGFRRLDLLVDPRALIPRPETEIVVERALARIAGLEAPRVLDVGTGTGAIALAIADEHPGARVTAMDISAEALELASENARRAGLTVELVEGDFRVALRGGPYDLVVSNPPYVDPADRDLLQPEVREWEPELALFATDAAEAVARGAASALAPGGALVLEVGDNQGGSASSRLAALGFAEVVVTLDLAGRDRVVEGTSGAAAPGG